MKTINLSSQRSIQVSFPRHQQLVELAHRRGLTLHELLGDFVNEAVKRGEISDRTPGLGIADDTGLVRLSDYSGAHVISLEVSTAELLVEMLKRRTETQPYRERTIKALNIDCATFDTLEVTRIGNGVQVKLPNGDQINAPVAIAADLARQIEKAIQAARQHAH